MKRKISIFLLLLFVVGAFSFTLNVNATTLASATDDTGKSEYNAVSHTETLLGDVTNYTMEEGTEKYNGVTSPFRVHMLSQKCDEDSKAVVWAMRDTNNSYIRGNVGAIAKDYEETHPGWKVIGGINADQYTQVQGLNVGSGQDIYTSQPYYSMICDNQRLFSINWYGNASNLVAFTNDGSNDQIVRLNPGSKESVLDSLYAYVYSADGEFEAKYPIQKLNEEPAADGSSVYASYYVKVGSGYGINNQEVSGEEIFFVENAKLAYVSNTKVYGTMFEEKAGRAEDAFFGEGVISSVETSCTLKKGQFAIKTNNEELSGALAVGKNVVVQYDYNEQNSIFNTVEAGVGYHLDQRIDGVDQNISGSYNTGRYTRSVVGQKADGTIVLMSIDSEKGSGASTSNNLATAFGVNAICKAHGIVDAYQMDGGGSVQMYVREGSTFVPVTQSRDAASGVTSQRSIYNAILFVVRSIDVQTDVADITTSSATLNFTDRMTHGKEIDSYIVEMNGERLETSEKELAIENLTSNTAYTYNLLVKSGDKEYKVSEGLSFKTLKQTPTLNDIVCVIEDGTIKITLDVTDPDKAVTDNYVAVAGSGTIYRNGVYTSKKFTLEAEVLIKISYRLDDSSDTYEITVRNPHFKSAKGFDNISQTLKQKLKEILK